MNNENEKDNEKLNLTTADKQNNHIKYLISKIKYKHAYFNEIPLEDRDNPKLVPIERKCGIREIVYRGYDVILNRFFVEELVTVKGEWTGKIFHQYITSYFYSFASFYYFLGGDIYENACYYKYNFSGNELIEFSIDIKKINTRSFIDYDIDIFNPNSGKIVLKQYEKAEELKSTLKNELNKLFSCKDYDEFKKTIDSLEFKNSPKFLDFYLLNFIFNDKKRAFDIIMQYVNNNYCNKLEEKLCFIYDPQKVFAAFDTKYESKRVASENKKRLAQFIKNLQNNKIESFYENYFDEEIHYYVFHRIGREKYDEKYYTIFDEIRYFETFEEFAKFLNNDLSYCDLSKANLLDFDLSEFKIGEHTKLPVRYQKNLICSVNKKYRKERSDFYVEQILSNERGQVIRTDSRAFIYFFDFVHFLRSDLSNADLLYCDGLENITDFSDLNLNNAMVRSNILDKIGVKYENYFKDNTEEFPIIQNNELETVDALVADRISFCYGDEYYYEKIYYISDLHLLHRLKNANSKSLSDATYIIQEIIDKLLANIGDLERAALLIGGDTASLLSLFELFVKSLRVSLDNRKLNIQVIFTLGNHELWDFDGVPFNEIVEKYRKVLSDNGMYLLQNNIILKYDSDKIEEISTEALLNTPKFELENRLKTARLILFGGLGFAGRNEEFNANQGIYRAAFNREQEIEESKKFELLYEKVCADLSDKRVIVFTHMPQKDWCSHNEKHSGFVYVSGHTHRNYFYDDGDYRIYADNQVGYFQKSCHLKYFYLEDDYDIFIDYKDGIYEITRDEYWDFSYGKNISIFFFRNFYKLYMLKKSGYYMFILQSSPNGNLNILNGGALKKLDNKSVNYYFKNMDSVISYIKTPLDKFSNYQRRIADEIKSIGGNGTIHGAIIDIDFFNHIYVNPIDLTVTAYWASDIINKEIYHDLPALLKSNCPDLYLNYLKLLDNKSETSIALRRSDTDLVKSPKRYLDTDIYRASREIKKIQKLHSNILSTWIEPPVNKLEDS